MDKVDINNLESVINEVKSETNIPNLRGNINDYKLVVDLTKDMKESLTSSRNQLYSLFKNEGFVVPDVIEDIVSLQNDDTDMDKVKEYLLAHISDSTKCDVSSKTDDEIKDILDSIKRSFILLHNIENEYHSIINESKEILEEYFNYINSIKAEDSIKKRIEIMKSINEIDLTTNKENQKKIEILEKSLNLSFITDTIYDVDKLVENFFKDNLSSYITRKFKTKIVKFGYNEDIFKHFFNIEETFLDEKYHPFNNLFLFIYMKFVGYADPYNKEDELYVKSITGAIANLIYHRFTSSDKENEIINFISSIIDKFIDAGYTDRFIMDNISYKNNEKYLLNKKLMDEQKRQMLIEKLGYYNIEYSDDMSNDELIELFDKKYAELEKNLLESNLGEDQKEVDNSLNDVKEFLKVDTINEAINNIKDSKNDTRCGDEGFENESNETNSEYSEKSECDGSVDNE